MRKLLILIASFSLVGTAIAATEVANPPPSDATPSPAAAAPVGATSDVIIQDQAQIEKDRRAIAADREKLSEASANLQRDRDKMIEDQRKLDDDRQGPGTKRSFWHRHSAPQTLPPSPQDADVKPAPASDMPAAATNPGGPVPAEMQSAPTQPAQ